MKRDMDLVRSILLHIEEHDRQIGASTYTNIKFQRYSLQQIGYHLKLLHQAGLIEDYDWPSGAGSLTWNGHEFIDAVRNDTIWERTKKRFGEESLGLAFEVVKKVAIDLVLQKVLPSK